MLRETLVQYGPSWPTGSDSWRMIRFILTKRYRPDRSPVLWRWEKAPVAVKAAVIDYLKLPRDPRWPRTAFTADNWTWSASPDHPQGCEYPPYNVPVG